MLCQIRKPLLFLKSPKVKVTGQNLVELVLTLPFLFIIVFSVVEIGRAWQTYQGAKMAAIDGAYTAAIFQSESIGESQIRNRLQDASIPTEVTDVTPVENNGSNNLTVGYKAQVRVLYRPIFGGLSIPTLSEPIVIIPSEFPIEYNGVYYSSFY